MLSISFSTFSSNSNIKQPNNQLNIISKDSLAKKEKNEWNITIHSGVTLSFSDGSDRFSSPFVKLIDNYERGMYYGISSAYRLKSFLSLDFLTGFGNAQGINTSNLVLGSQPFRFESNFFDTELKAIFFPFQAILGKNFRQIDPYISAGVGFTSYRSVQYVLLTNTVNDYFGYQNNSLEKSSPKYAFSIPFGIGADFRINKLFSININQSFKYLNTSSFDAYDKTNSRDFYSKTTIGLKVNFNSMKRTEKKSGQELFIDEPFTPTPFKHSIQQPETIEPNVSEHNIKVRINRGNIDKNISTTNRLRFPEDKFNVDDQKSDSLHLDKTPLPNSEFRIQIFASTKKRENPQNLLAILGIKGNLKVNEEFHNGLFVYTVNSFTSLKDALNYRKLLVEQGVIDSFIVGYLNGVRQQKISDLFLDSN